MAKSIQRANERSPEDLARLRELRKFYQREKPSLSDLEALGAEFMPLGEVVLLRSLADDLRQERERQRLSVDHLAARMNVTPETLAAIEAGTVGQLTLGLLSRIAHALGKKITYSLLEKVA